MGGFTSSALRASELVYKRFECGNSSHHLSIYQVISDSHFIHSHGVQWFGNGRLSFKACASGMKFQN